jgi:hypothetical protein
MGVVYKAEDTRLHRFVLGGVAIQLVTLDNARNGRMLLSNQPNGILPERSASAVRLNRPRLQSAELLQAHQKAPNRGRW